MSLRFVDIPAELVVDIANFAQQDVSSLSRTCRGLYELLGPYTFSTIMLYNTQKSAKAVEYLLSTPKAGFVKTLVFKGEAPGETAASYLDVAGILRVEVSDILSKLSRFPNLYSLIIDLNLHFGGHEAYHHWMTSSLISLQPITMRLQSRTRTRSNAWHGGRWRPRLYKLFLLILPTLSAASYTGIVP